MEYVFSYFTKLSAGNGFFQLVSLYELAQTAGYINGFACNTLMRLNGTFLTCCKTTEHLTVTEHKSNNELVYISAYMQQTDSVG